MNDMEFTEDDQRRGDPAPRRRSPARIAMDSHVDTGKWITTQVPESDLDAVKRRLYTLANKAGYSLRTEAGPGGDGSIALRLLVRNRKERGDAHDSQRR